MKDRVSLLIAGGLTTPGEFLKAIALGADAVYIGTIALFALSHTQVLQSLPFEPPTQLVFHHGQTANKLKTNRAAQHLANFLNSCALEMSEGIKALGKTSLAQVNHDDLVALNPVVAEAARVPQASRPLEK